MLFAATTVPAYSGQSVVPPPRVLRTHGPSRARGLSQRWRGKTAGASRQGNSRAGIRIARASDHRPGVEPGSQDCARHSICPHGWQSRWTAAWIWHRQSCPHLRRRQ
eukprot:961982-Prymnesium_polylepis.1